MVKQAFPIVICIVLLICAGCVDPQRYSALETRVAAIEMANNRQASKQQQKELQDRLYAVERKLEDSPVATQEEYAEIRYDIQTIKEDVQRLEGLIQEMNHRFGDVSQKEKQEIDKQIGRLDQAISRNYEKVLRLEEHMGFEPTVAGEKSVNTDSKQPETQNSEQADYEFAKKLFDQGDMENARIQFENFINKYPDSKNADNARFWIADSFYAEKWYEQAILEYQKVLELYPDSNKLASARLKQGYAFAELGELANARIILNDLIKKHPDSDEAKYAREKLKHLK